MSDESRSVPARAAVFDVGAVLIDWDPRHLYRKLLPDERSVDHFLREICTQAWNVEQDRGRSWADAIVERTSLFPAHEALIRAYDERWLEMVAGPIAPNVAFLEDLKAAGVPVYGLTNFSAEKWAVATEAYPFLTLFDAVVVSGEEGVIKPDPAIYQLLFQRMAEPPDAAIFFDDRPENCAAAEALGLPSIVVRPDVDLRAAARAAGLRV